MRYLVFVIAMTAFPATNAQLSTISKLPDDTVKVIALLDLGYQYESKNPDSAILIYEIAGVLAKSLDYHLGYGRSLNYRGIVEFERGGYTKSEKYYLESIQVFQKIDYKKGIAAAYNNIGNIYLSSGDMDKSIEYNLKGMTLLEETGDTASLIYALTNLGTILYDNKQYRKSEHYYLEALHLARNLVDFPAISDTYLNLSNTYKVLGDSAKYAEYLNLALTKVNPESDRYIAVLIYTAYSNFLSDAGKMKSSLEYAKKAMELAEKDGNPYTYCKTLVLTGEKYFLLSRIEKAQHYYDEALKIAISNNYIEVLEWLRYNRAQLNAKRSDYKAAYDELIALNVVKDTLNHQNRQRIVQEMETKYQTAKKESWITEQSLIINEQEYRVKRQRSLIIWILITVSGVVFTFILGVAYIQQRRKSLREQLFSLKKEKELTNMRYLIEGEEKERSRLAKELHDGVNGSLGAIKLLASSEAVQTTSKNSEKWENISTMIDQVSNEVREISHNLMPDILVRLGLADSLQAYINKIQRANTLEIDLQIYGDCEQVDISVKITLYRIVQELLRNIVKHARAGTCIIQLNSHASEISLIVEDNGIGFDVFDYSKNPGAGGIGLQSIYSRIELLGGKFDIQSGHSSGTSVHINIPINQQPL